MVALNSREITHHLVSTATFYLLQFRNHRKHFPFHAATTTATTATTYTLAMPNDDGNRWRAFECVFQRLFLRLLLHFVREIVCTHINTLELSFAWTIYWSCYLYYIFKQIFFLFSFVLVSLFIPLARFFFFILSHQFAGIFTIHLCINLEIANAIVMNRRIFVLILFFIFFSSWAVICVLYGFVWGAHNVITSRFFWFTLNTLACALSLSINE